MYYNWINCCKDQPRLQTVNKGKFSVNIAPSFYTTEHLKFWRFCRQSHLRYSRLLNPIDQYLALKWRIWATIIEKYLNSNQSKKRGARVDDGSRLSRKNNRARCDGISIQIEWSGTPGSNPSSLGACFSKAPKSCSKISDPMTGKLFYVHIFNMNSCPFHARSFRRIHLSVFPDILLCS